jgi:DNA-binding LacI/PurR family transcriptional regulator
MDVIGLSTIHQPMDEFGGWAARSIASLLGRGEGAKTVARVESLQLPIELVVRGTSRASADRTK